MSDSELNVLRGSLDLLILKSLSWAPRHGYAVAEWIEQATDATFLIEEGTLYPALHRLERKGWVATEWGMSENNRKAKFYRLTAAGRAQLHRDAPLWHRYADAIARALRAPSPGAA
jgi:transcriptional regulator